MVIILRILRVHVRKPTVPACFPSLSVGLAMQDLSPPRTAEDEKTEPTELRQNPCWDRCSEPFFGIFMSHAVTKPTKIKSETGLWADLLTILTETGQGESRPESMVCDYDDSPMRRKILILRKKGIMLCIERVCFLTYYNLTAWNTILKQKHGTDLSKFSLFCLFCTWSICIH